MTEKRFKLYQSTDGSEEYVCDNGVALRTDEEVDLLNDLLEENEQLKKQIESEHTMLDNAILLERTRMGQNSLKQYKEAIQ